jgi:hypothetical protein
MWRVNFGNCHGGKLGRLDCRTLTNRREKPDFGQFCLSIKSHIAVQHFVRQTVGKVWED